MPSKHPLTKTNTPGVFRRGEKWVRRLDAPADDGKRHQRWITRNTKRELDAEVKRLTAAVVTGTYAPPSSATVSDVLDRWLNSVSMQVRPLTLERYRYSAQSARKWLGSVQVQQLKGDHLDKLYADMLAAGVSAYTIIDVHSAVRDALNLAVRRNIVSRNVTLTVKPPRPKKKEMMTVDASGAAKLLAVAESTDLHTLIAFTLATGLRRSEVLGLQWRDVDLEGAELHVRRGLHVLKGQVVYESPKSATSRRTVALPPSACILLRNHKERLEALAADLGGELVPEHHVFVRQDFSPMRPDHVTHGFARTAKRAGFPGLRFHDLRHSHATIMLAQNVHPKIVSDRLGHANIKITLDLYSHPGADLQEKAAAAFDAALMAGRDVAPAKSLA